MSMHRTNFQRGKFWPRRWRLGFLFGCAVVVACAAAAVSGRAQEKNPFFGEAEAAKVGEAQVPANCAFCHGLGGRGGGRGTGFTRGAEGDREAGDGRFL